MRSEIVDYSFGIAFWNIFVLPIIKQMYFKDDEVKKMQTVLMRLDPGTVSSIQDFDKDNQFRTGYTIAVYNKWNKPLCVFQNYEKLSPWRRKLLLKLSLKIPYGLHITYPKEDITRVGWKVAK